MTDNGLDNDVVLICIIVLPVSSFHFQSVTFCNRLISLFIQAVFQNLPIVSCSLIIRLLYQHLNNIYYREIPCLRFLIIYSADFVIFKYSKRVFFHILPPFSISCGVLHAHVFSFTSQWPPFFGPTNLNRPALTSFEEALSTARSDLPIFEATSAKVISGFSSSILRI
jgi:hypothetical protein